MDAAAEPVGIRRCSPATLRRTNKLLIFMGYLEIRKEIPRLRPEGLRQRHKMDIIHLF
jgi:hypothetical protein